MATPRRLSVLDKLYQEYLTSQDSSAFLQQVGRYYSTGTLERLTYQSSRATRRAAYLALGFLGEYESNAAMGRGLVDPDRAVRLIAENGIRALWRRSGTPAQRQRLNAIIRLNSSQHYEKAVERAADLIRQAPDLAEGWNQRAIAHYNLNEFSESVRDCHRALELNPYHFDAATGMGQCYLQLNDQRAALECFRRALRLNPCLEGVRAGIDYLERTLRKRQR
ncbi:MAG: tetratricopeptide repeat protein [Planctomycetaceae bacterium]|nr:tetratricopeptide repeat protein [Planctomycetaceae bacterium]